MGGNLLGPLSDRVIEGVASRKMRRENQ